MASSPVMTTAPPTPGYAIEAFELAMLSDRDIRQIAELRNALGGERFPEDPPTPTEVAVDRLRARPKMIEFTDWLARAADGQIVGTATLIRIVAETNQLYRETEIGVLPGHRRRGLARRFLREMVDAVPAEAVKLQFSTNGRIPAGEAFTKAVGASEVLRARFSQLAVGEVDRAMTADWAKLDPPGYRLAWVDADVTDELMAHVVTAYEAMNTAPRGASAMEDWHITAAEVREFDRARKATGRERRLVLAIDDATGETAGYTEVVYDPRVPHVIQQQGTAVIPAHRGRGIGKWVKAAMLERVLGEWPDARYIRTGNASVNAPMLAINTRLGFRHAWDGALWEASVADLRAYLERRA